MKIDNKKFAERRKRMGYTQSQLASGICTASQVCQFEKGVAGINEHRLKQLLERLDLTLKDVLLPEEQTKQWKRPKSYDRKEMKLMLDDVMEAIETCNSLQDIGWRAVQVFRQWEMVPDELYAKLTSLKGGELRARETPDA